MKICTKGGAFMAWLYEPIEKEVREWAEREGRAEILEMSSLQLRAMIKEFLQDCIDAPERKNWGDCKRN
jgi:hypothetical protein